MKKIVIKIGSSVLFEDGINFNTRFLAGYAVQIKKLKTQGYAVVLVLSGAVAMGSNFVPLENGEIAPRQAAAGIGQAIVISEVLRIFNQHGLGISQLLLTRNSLNNDRKKSGFANLINYYFEKGIVPVLNENDTNELNSFGGNDVLAARISGIIKADQLLILSTMKGSKYGIGGGQTKNWARDYLRNKNIRIAIENGMSKDIIVNTVL